MLILKSFLMSDEKGMNDALAKHTLSKGASVFVSDGHIVMQMDDGKPMTNAQKLVQEQEARHTHATHLLPVEHSQNVLQIQIDAITAQIETLTTTIKQAKEKTSKITGIERQQMEGKLKRLENVLAQFEQQFNNNKAEIDQIIVNLKVYDDRISDLQEFPDVE